MLVKFGEGVKARDLAVDIKASRLKVGLKGKAPLIDVSAITMLYFETYFLKLSNSVFTFGCRGNYLQRFCQRIALGQLRVGSDYVL
jgi:hypothetical protein